MKNYLRMTFHPLGISKFMKYMNEDLKLGESQCKINMVLGYTCDFLRTGTVLFVIIYLIILFSK